MIIVCTEGSKKSTHSLIVNIFGTKWHIVTILMRYCSVMFSHVCTCERFYLQQDGVPPHYHRHVRVYLDDTTWTKARSKRCYWVPTMVSRPNTSRLLPVGNLEEWSLTKASHTEHATRTHRRVMCSHHTRHTDSHSSLSSSAASTLFWPLMVVTSNTYNDSLSLHATIVTTCHFVPDILTIKSEYIFLDPTVYSRSSDLSCISFPLWHRVH
jgi:hypothetical protein